MGIREEITKRVRSTGHQPFLFLGAGISQRYMGLPNWEDLLRKFATELSGNSYQYELYANRVEEEDYYGRQPEIAKLLEKDFNEAALREEKYEKFRELHSTDLHAGVSALKLAISDFCKERDIQSRSENEIELLKRAAKKNISGVITTNYDMLTETLFEDYRVFVGQEQMLFADLYEFGEIYKIHGSASDPASIVLTADDYSRLEETQPYLIAKILTIFMEYPIIFMGYSIQDKDIQNILQTISVCLDQEHLDIIRDRLIFIEFADGVSIGEAHFAFEKGKQIEMTRVRTRDFTPVYEAILSSESTYSPKVLGRLRRDIYEMVNVTRPSAKVQVTGFEGLEKLGDNERVVIGVGTKVGVPHVLPNAEPIYEDVINDDKYYDPNLVVDEYLPYLLKSNAGGLPMFKYLQQYEKPTYGKVQEYVLRHQNIDDFLNKALIQLKQSFRREQPNLSVSGILEREDFAVAYRKMNYLEPSEINLEDLNKYLKQLLKQEGNQILRGNSELKRLIRIYDWLKYKSTSTKTSNSANT